MTTDKLSTTSTDMMPNIDFGKLDHRPCICGGILYRFSDPTHDRWICDLCCGAAGDSYKEAVRAKIKFDFETLAARTRDFLKQSHVAL